MCSEREIWVQYQFREFFITPQVAAMAVECESVTVSADLDREEVAAQFYSGAPIKSLDHPTSRFPRLLGNGIVRRREAAEFSL
jgi:hypothetical protein